MIHKLHFLMAIVIAWLAVGASQILAQSENIAPPEKYRAAADALSKFIGREIQQKQIPAFSIAVVDENGLIWAQGFGFEDREQKRPATAQTVYRVGSVSKLLSDVAVVQLIEQGKLKLEDDVQSVLPDFRPKNPFGPPIKLRHLMNHQSGLVRESPVGNYFDPTAPSLGQTVLSLNDTTLVYTPGSKTKYSNSAVAVAGYAVEKVTGQPFAEYMQTALLQPLQMTSSSYASTDRIQARLAAGDMWSYDGRRFPAPDLSMGAVPAGNLYSTVVDLSQFMRAILNDGTLDNRRILSPELMAEMLGKPAADKKQRTFGIGFAVGDFDGLQTFEHGGAIYGFATDFRGLKEKGIGVIAVGSLDVANGFVKRVAEDALRSFLAVKEGKNVNEPRSTTPIDRAFARQVAGLYSNGTATARLIETAGRLRLQEGAMDRDVRRLGEEYVIDDVQAFGPELVFGQGQFQLGTTNWKRINEPLPAPPPERWLGLIGEYGWDHDILFVYEDGGRLWVLIEWVFRYPLTEESENVFAFPGYGLYQDEKIIFTRDSAGKATVALAAEVPFLRRDAELDSGKTFKIQPLFPAERLREVALAADPPAEPRDFLPVDLVELTSLDPTIKLDIRYATTNNFMGTVFYEQPRAFMQRPAAEALVKALQGLKEQGYGLLVHDAYRPWFVTKMFWEATPVELRRFVANPDNGSRHNRGCAVDLTLYDLKTGAVVPMVSGYDEFSERAYPNYVGGTARERWHRELLRRSMESVGFDVYEFEWWHFDFHQWRDYPILNRPFETIGQK